MPSVASAAVNCRRAMFAAAIRTARSVVILFGDDPMTMIEKVEGARERERVLRKVRRFRRSCALRDHFIKPFGQHHQRPDLRARLTRQHFRNRFRAIATRGCRRDQLLQP